MTQGDNTATTQQESYVPLPADNTWDTETARLWCLRVHPQLSARNSYVRVLQRTLHASRVYPAPEWSLDTSRQGLRQWTGWNSVVLPVAGRTCQVTWQFELLAHAAILRLLARNNCHKDVMRERIIFAYRLTPDLAALAPNEAKETQHRLTLLGSEYSSGEAFRKPLCQLAYTPEYVPLINRVLSVMTTGSNQEFVKLFNPELVHGFRSDDDHDIDDIAQMAVSAPYVLRAFGCDDQGSADQQQKSGRAQRAVSTGVSAVTRGDTDA